MASLTPEQQKVLARIRAVGRRRGASPKEVKAAIETGLVESNLKNLSGGDADSAGWRQERASLYKDPTNLDASINRFFDETSAVKHKYGNAGDLAAAVQRPAAQYRGRYQQRSGEAQALLGSGGSTGGAARTSTRTVGAVDNSGARGQAVFQFLQSKSTDPLRLATSLQGLQDSPGRKVTTRSAEPSTATPSASDAPQGSGHVTVAPGANRAGAGLSKELLGFVDAVSANSHRPITIGTGTNHNQMTVNGNVSDHWDGHGADLPMPIDSRQGDLTAAHALQTAGIPLDQALQMAKKGGLYNVTPTSGPWKGHRVQVIWKTNEGGNHHNHVHIGIR